MNAPSLLERVRAFNDHVDGCTECQTHEFVRLENPPGGNRLCPIGTALMMATLLKELPPVGIVTDGS